jgi:hypothetical protein
VLRGESGQWNDHSDFIFHTELYIDGKLAEKPELPSNFTTRRYEICWKYDLPKGKHSVELKLLNTNDAHHINITNVICYTDKPVDGFKESEGAK